MENSTEISLKTRNKTTIRPSDPTTRHVSWGNQKWKRHMFPNAALFIIAKTQKQPRCPLTEEWIKKLWYIYTMEYSVQFSYSVVSDSLQPHVSQHARPPCPPSPGVHSNSYPSSRWCHPAISSCCPLLLLPPIPPSIRVFSNESTLHMR